MFRLDRLLALTFVAVAGCHHAALPSATDGGGPDAVGASLTPDTAVMADLLLDAPADLAADAAPPADLTLMEAAPMPVDAEPDGPPGTLPADAGPPDGANAGPPDVADARAPDVADAGCQTGCRPSAEWLRVITGESDIQLPARGMSLVAGSAGRLYMTAQFRRNAMLAGQPITNTSQLDHVDSLVAAFDPAGTQRWLQLVSGTLDQAILGLAREQGGQVYLSARSSQGGPAAVGGKPAGADSFFAGLSADDGQALWVESAAPPSDIVPWVIAVDPAGNLYVSGFYKGQVQFGDLKLTSASTKLFVASFAPDRKGRWLREVEGVSLPSIAVRGVDDIILTGTFEQLGIDGQTWKATAYRDVFFTALGPGGSAKWTTVVPGPSSVSSGIVRGIGVDASGAIYASGEMGDGGANVIALVALSEAGAVRWKLTSTALGGVAQMSAVAVGPDGGVYFAARIAGDVTLGAQTFHRSEDTYLARFEGDGRVRWAMNFGGTPSWAYAIAPLPGGRLGLLGLIRQADAVLGLPLRSDGAAVTEAYYLLSLKQP